MEPQRTNEPRTAQDSAATRIEALPALALTGSPADKVRTLDAAIVQLYELRSSLSGEPFPMRQPPGLHGRYLNAPAWPWFAAGWALGALFVLLLLMARRFA